MRLFTSGNHSKLYCIFLFLIIALNLSAALPEKIQEIMQQPRYQHSSWALLAKDTTTGEIVYDLNGDKMITPASLTKLFSMAALLKAYGDDYRFNTPVYAVGKIDEGKLSGNLILVGQGDLTLGGRQDEGFDTLAFTKLDHIIANSVPGVILTSQNPLNGLISLAKQIHDKGINEIEGDVLIDDRLFEITHKRDMVLSPTILNENLIDFVLNPTEEGQKASLSLRPQVEGYTVTNEVKTVGNDQELDIQITPDEAGTHIVLKGTIPLGQKNLVRTFSIQDANQFVRNAFIQVLRKQGIIVKLKEGGKLPPQANLKDLQPIAVLTSPPLTEYAKLILKVSHNLGADLAPLLLAAHKGETTFDEGMLLLGKFLTEEVGLDKNSFVFIDGAGGDSNRITPKAIIQLLEYMQKQPKDAFQKFMWALPILGVDGSLADFGKSTQAMGKVFAKTGTGVSFNLATQQFFLTTQTLGGYIKGQNGHLILFVIAVGNATMPKIIDVFPIFEDQSIISSILAE